MRYKNRIVYYLETLDSALNSPPHGYEFHSITPFDGYALVIYEKMEEK